MRPIRHGLVVAVISVLIAAAHGASDPIVGRWRLLTGPQEQVGAAVRFNSDKTGTMVLSGGRGEEIRFRYEVSGNTLTMRATRFTVQGKRQTPPRSKIVLSMSWKGKDRVEVVEVGGSTGKRRKDVLVRVK